MGLPDADRVVETVATDPALAQMDLAVDSRAAFSSFRSGCEGGKNAADCGPRHAAFNCQHLGPWRIKPPGPHLGTPSVSPSAVTYRRVIAAIKGRDQDFPGDASRGRRAATRDNYARPTMDVATFCARATSSSSPARAGWARRRSRRRWPGWLRGRAVGARRRARGQVGVSPAPSATAGTSPTRRSCSPRSRRSGVRAARPARGSIRARRLTPDDALVEYLEDHGLRRVSKRLARSGVLDVVSTAIPGIRDVLVLGKVKQLERDGAADLIVVDAPATGHAITFLTSASGLVGAARGGPLRTQAEDVVELLTDPARCRVILVTLPEELPVSETIESAYTLEDEAGVQLGPVIVNACDPEPTGLDRPRRTWRRPPGSARPRTTWPRSRGPELPAGPPRRLHRTDRAAAPRPPAAPAARAGPRPRPPSARHSPGAGGRAGGRGGELVPEGAA